MTPCSGRPNCVNVVGPPGLIKQFLGEPDKLVLNQHYRSGPKIRLWAVERVEKIEKLEAFRVQREKGAKRSTAAAAAASSQRQQLLESIARMEIEVEVLEPSTPLERAIDHYNMRNWLRGRRAEQGSDPAFLQRIQVDFIRHELTAYDEELDRVACKIGAADARDAIRDKIYYAMAEAYPELEEEL